MYFIIEMGGGPQANTTFVQFASEDAVINYIDQPLYSQTSDLFILSTAIIFNGGYPHWDYSIRLNMTIINTYGNYDAVPTNIKAVDISVQTNQDYPQLNNYNLYGPYLETYEQMEYFVATDIVNSFIASMACRGTGKCASESVVNVNAFGFVDFPYAKVLISNFWSSLGSTFALLMIISVMYPLSNIVKSLIVEKESKMREGMMMMALTGEALWISWILHFFMLLLSLSILLTLASSILFSYSTSNYIFLYYFFFLMSSMSFCILVSTFFSKSRTGSIVTNLLFLCGYFIYIGMTSSSSSTSRSSVMLACLHPATAFTYATLIFAVSVKQFVLVLIIFYSYLFL